MLQEVELIILNWTRSIESKVDIEIVFFLKIRGIYVHAGFALTTGIGDSIGICVAIKIYYVEDLSFYPVILFLTVVTVLQEERNQLN